MMMNMAERLTRYDRRLVQARLDQLGAELSAIASWLTGLDEDRAAVALECASRDVFCVCWLLDADARSRPDAWLGPVGGQQGTAGRYGG
jgi:hypothetical protein